MLEERNKVENERIGRLLEGHAERANRPLEFDVSYNGRAILIGMLPINRSYRVYNGDGNHFDVPAGKGVLQVLLSRQAVEDRKGLTGADNKWDYNYNVFRVEDKK